MARMLIVLFVVLSVGVGPAAGQVVNAGDSDSVRLARVRVLMDQEPSGSGSLLNGSGSLFGSGLTLEPERFAVAQSRRGSGSGNQGWLRWYRWVGMGMLAYGSVRLVDVLQSPTVEDDPVRDYALGGLIGGGIGLLLVDF